MFDLTYIQTFYQNFHTTSPFLDSRVTKFLYDRMISHDDLVNLYQSFMTRPKQCRVSKRENKDQIYETAQTYNPYFNEELAEHFNIKERYSSGSNYLWDDGDWQYKGGFFQIGNLYFNKQEFYPKIRIYLSMDYNFLHKYFFATFLKKVNDIELDQNISISGKCPCVFKVDCGFASEDKWFLRSDNVVIYTIEKYLPFMMKALNDTFDSIPDESLELENNLLTQNIFKPSMTCHSFTDNENLSFIEKNIGLAPELSGCVESYNEDIAKFLINYKKEHKVLDFDTFHSFIQENLEKAKTVNFNEWNFSFKINMLQPLINNGRLEKVLKGEDPDRI